MHVFMSVPFVTFALLSIETSESLFASTFWHLSRISYGELGLYIFTICRRPRNLFGTMNNTRPNYARMQIGWYYFVLCMYQRSVVVSAKTAKARFAAGRSPKKDKNEAFPFCIDLSALECEKSVVFSVCLFVNKVTLSRRYKTFPGISLFVYKTYSFYFFRIRPW